MRRLVKAVTSLTYTSPLPSTSLRVMLNIFASGLQVHLYSVNVVVENGDLLFLHLLFLSCYVVCKYLIFGLLTQNYTIIYFRHSCGG